jgi:hypothetical protein
MPSQSVNHNMPYSIDCIGMAGFDLSLLSSNSAIWSATNVVVKEHREATDRQQQVYGEDQYDLSEDEEDFLEEGEEDIDYDADFEYDEISEDGDDDDLEENISEQQNSPAAHPIQGPNVEAPPAYDGSPPANYYFAPFPMDYNPGPDVPAYDWGVLRNYHAAMQYNVDYGVYFHHSLPTSG